MRSGATCSTLGSPSGLHRNKLVNRFSKRELKSEQYTWSTDCSHCLRCFHLTKQYRNGVDNPAEIKWSELSQLHLSRSLFVCLSAGRGDQRLSGLQKSTTLLLPQVSWDFFQVYIKYFCHYQRPSELVLVSTTTGSEPSGQSSAVRSTPPVTLTTAATVTSPTLTEHKLPSIKESE